MLLLSFVPVLYTAIAAGIKYQDISPGTCIRARARVPSPSPLRSSVGPEPEPSSLDSEMDDTLSLAELPREPEHHPCRSVGEHLLVHTAEVYQVHVEVEKNSNSGLIRECSYRTLLLLYVPRVCKVLERI